MEQITSTKEVALLELKISFNPAHSGPCSFLWQLDKLSVFRTTNKDVIVLREIVSPFTGVYVHNFRLSQHNHRAEQWRHVLCAVRSEVWYSSSFLDLPHGCLSYALSWTLKGVRCIKARRMTNSNCKGYHGVANVCGCTLIRSHKACGCNRKQYPQSTQFEFPG
jgi:hypothetical protein